MHLSINNLSKSYGDQPVLDRVSFIVNAGERLGLVGANGVGKSTLLKLILGEIEPDTGTISIPAGIRLGYLPQAMADFGDKTLDDLIAETLHELSRLESQLRDLEQQMTTAGETLPEIMQEYGEIAEKFEYRGGYEIEHRLTAILDGLRIGHISHQRRASTLSGGEKARLGLGLLLLQVPDVLLLDEPTNHLDFAMLAWLEDYLQDYPGAILIVSHDRAFLNRTVQSIIEIEEHSRQAKHYAGNYDAYLVAKVLERTRWQADYERQQDEIKALRQEIKGSARQVAHNRAPTDGDKFLKHYRRGRVENSISRRVSSAAERLQRIESDPIPQPPDPLRFDADFDPAALKSRMPLLVSGLNKSFGTRRLLHDVSFTLGPHSRIVLVGPNGAGKSTLLRILAGLESYDSGELYINPQVHIGYLDQDQSSLDPGWTVFDTYRDGLSGEEQQHKAILLSSGLFRYPELNRLVGQLSSGQKRKLQIARLIAERVNLLLLDEPTNYVSFDVLESLETALHDFPGPIIAVSHDRRFIEQFGGEVWALENGHLTVQPNITLAEEAR